MQTFNLSANIENGFAKGMQYIVTPNAQNVVNNLINGFKTGIHSYMGHRTKRILRVGRKRHQTC